MYSGFITFCYVADLDRSACFYEHVLGLELALDQGTCRIYAVTETAFIGLCTREDSPRPESVILTLLVDDVQERCDELVARGAVLEKPAQHNEKYRIEHAFLRDPDGYLLEVQRFVDERWTGP